MAASDATKKLKVKSIDHLKYSKTCQKPPLKNPDPTYQPKCPLPQSLYMYTICHIVLAWVAKVNPMQIDVKDLPHVFSSPELKAKGELL